MLVEYYFMYETGCDNNGSVLMQAGEWNEYCTIKRSSGERFDERDTLTMVDGKHTPHPILSISWRTLVSFSIIPHTIYMVNDS